MSEIDKQTIQDSILYHETNLASLIEKRNAARERAASGKYIVESYFEKLDRDIANIEKIIFNWRTKGRGYD